MCRQLARTLRACHEAQRVEFSALGSPLGKVREFRYLGSVLSETDSDWPALRRNLAKAYRSLRWTHHVRQMALRRLGPSGDRVSKLDPILDVVNIATFVVMVVVVFTTAPA